MPAVPAPPAEAVAQAQAKGALLVHLPGIGGIRRCDRRMLAGLKDAGVSAGVIVYDWTDHDPGLHALCAWDRNHAEAQKIADLIVAHAQADPASPVYLTAHSGGCGVAVWALEKLPDHVMVDTLLLMAPALSPQYDLSAALRHVRGNAYAFTSQYDTLVLYSGTRTFGTMDGVFSEAAGYSGFVRPPHGDAEMYKKLIQRPYDPRWESLGDRGDHLGAMSRRFSAVILAPLLHGADGEPATRPAQPTNDHVAQ
jgi:pimeloyl-ACP methyl ester carboxylesterase